ncbi:hypothetical protein GCM10022395_32710 [Snuella lapsa]|uniref:Uncharacterized protein n=2 Tax=Snuella lapsa TaxID=870481 RepID=A0ABP6YEX8_9FLAO
MQFSNGMKLLDMMPSGYTPEYVSKLFATLGHEGRRLYLWNQIPIDMVYPFLFGICYSLLLIYFFKKINRLNSKILYLGILPIIAGIADYTENFGIITMLNTTPENIQTIAQLTNVFTLIKSIASTIYFVILLVTIIVLLAKKMKKRISK